MKCFIFGVSGLVGSACARAAVRRRLQVHGFHGKTGSGIEGLRSERSIDVTDTEVLERLVLDEWPDVVINAAAISNPAGVDQDPARAERVNVQFPRQLSLLCRHLGSRFIHFSTDMVFDGTAASYRSTDVPNPVGLYGQTKLMAEKAVLEANPNNPVVLRITLVNGNSVTGQRSVHEKLLSAIHDGQRPTLFTDEMRQPCSADSVAEVAVELTERQDLSGLFHWAGSEVVSRYELGRRILQKFGLSEDFLQAARQADIPALADRPQRLVFNLHPLEGKLKTRPPYLSEQIASLQPPPHLYRWLREMRRTN